HYPGSEEITSRNQMSLPQKKPILQNINSIFASCHKKISNYTIWIAQNCFQTIQLDSKEQFNKSQTVQTRIPFRYQISHVLDSGRRMKPSDFHSQFHLKVSFFYFYLYSYLFFFISNHSNLSLVYCITQRRSSHLRMTNCGGNKTKKDCTSQSILF
ncbi:hypothetical protein VP01_3164g3, partial [Puccinia sorghi]